MSKNLDSIIEHAKTDLANQFMVAFLGERYSGKTIACALIKDALTRHYEKYTKGEYIGISTDGSKKMNQLMDKLTNGQFPAKTLLSEATPMTMEIISPVHGNKIEIVLRDMAGEKRKDLLEEDFPNVDERLKVIFKTAIITGKDYGLLTHVVFAKMYIIMIDCSKFKDVHKIRMEESYVKDTIRRLFEIKERLGDLTNNRIHDPFAFIFTKYDQLPTEMQKTPSELINELSEITGALKRYHDGDIAYFKSSVESEKLSDKEIQDAVREKQSSGNEDLKTAENNLNDLTVKKDDTKLELEQAQQSLIVLQKKLEQAKASGNQNAIDNAANEVTDAENEVNSAQEAFDELTEQLDTARKRLTKIKEELANNPPNTPEELGISEYKPKKPLQYSLEDYLQLIDWIIKMHKKISGFSK